MLAHPPAHHLEFGAPRVDLANGRQTAQSGNLPKIPVGRDSCFAARRWMAIARPDCGSLRRVIYISICGYARQFLLQANKPNQLLVLRTGDFQRFTWWFLPRMAGLTILLASATRSFATTTVTS
jgi:hypothetical protein